MGEVVANTETKYYDGCGPSGVWTKTGATNCNGISDYQLLLEYVANGTVRGCVDINANSVAGAELTAWKKVKASSNVAKYIRKSVAEYEEVEDHGVLEAITPELLFVTSAYLDILGRAYWRKADNVYTEQIEKFFALLPECVKEIRDTSGAITSYEYRVAGKPMESIPAEEVVRFRLPLGSSPLASVYQQVRLSDKASRYVEAVMDNGGVPGLLISNKDKDAPVSEECAKRLVEEWRARIRRGGVAFADGSIEVHPLTLPPTDLAPIQIDEHTAKRVAFALGIPEPLLHGNAATFSNLDVARFIHAEKKVAPVLNYIARQINEYIMPAYGDDSITVEFEDVVPPDKEYELKQATERRASVETAGKLKETPGAILTENEARTILGLQTVEGGDTRYVGIAATATATPNVPANGSAAAPAPAAAADAAPAVDAVAAPDQQIQTTEAAVLNGAQITAAVAIVTAVVAGTLPRDAGLGMLSVCFNLTPEVAAQLMGSAGTSKPTTPNPVPAVAAVNEDVAAGKMTRAVGISLVARALDIEEAEARKLVGYGPKAKGCSHEKAMPALTSVEKQIKSKVAAFFHSLKSQALNVTKSAEPSGDDLTSDLSALFTKDDTGNVPTAFVEIEDWADNLRGKADDLAHEVMPLIELTITESADHKSEALIKAGASPDAFSVMPQKIKEAVDRRGFAFADSTMSTTTKTLRTAIDAVRERIGHGLEIGQSVDELRRSISEVFENAAEYQAERIARSEASAAVHAGQVIAAKESGIVTGFRYLVSSDACPLCQEYADQVVPIDDYDDSGAVDADGAVPLHPNCTCTLTEEIGDTNEVSD